MNPATRRADVLRGARTTSIFGLVWWFAGFGTLPTPAIGIPLLALGIAPPAIPRMVRAISLVGPWRVAKG